MHFKAERGGCQPSGLFDRYLRARSEHAERQAGAYRAELAKLGAGPGYAQIIPTWVISGWQVGASGLPVE